jgi:Ca2+/Na+ antiporter
MSGAIPPLHQYAFMAWCLVIITGIILLLLYFTPQIMASIEYIIHKINEHSENHKEGYILWTCSFLRVCHTYRYDFYMDSSATGISEDSQ